jgi:hypothetical protein
VESERLEPLDRKEFKVKSALLVQLDLQVLLAPLVLQESLAQSVLQAQQVPRA